MTNVLFFVIGSSKTERITKEGHHETLYRASLKSEDGKLKLSIVDTSSELLIKYPIRSEVHVNIGRSNQSTLTDQELEKAVEEDAEED